MNFYTIFGMRDYHVFPIFTSLEEKIFGNFDTIFVSFDNLYSL